MALPLKFLKKIVSEITENCRFRQPHCRLTPLLHGTPASISTNFVLLETSHWATFFAADSMGLSSLKFSWWAPKDAYFWNTVRNGRSRSTKVVNFHINRKGVCNPLLVINSKTNLGPILQVFGWQQRPHPYSTRILECSRAPWTRSPC